MAATSVDAALIEAAAAAHRAKRQAKVDRARAVDNLIELLLERTTLRGLLRDTLPHLPASLAALVREQGIG